MKALAVLLAIAGPAAAHDQWANGSSVPPWVKSACCGPDDVHHLRPDQVHDEGDAYHVDGLNRLIPRREALPSQDGDYWIFYRPAENPVVHCFFVPMVF